MAKRTKRPNPPLGVIILAAGKGTRMKSTRAKVLHHIAGKPLLAYPLAVAAELQAEKTLLVLGHGVEQVKSWLKQEVIAVPKIIVQREQRGTGHAVQQAIPALREWDGVVLVLYGDVPLVTAERLSELLRAARRGRFSLLTMNMADPSGYGRVIRDTRGRVTAVVEDRDATPAERQVSECNAGICAAPWSWMREALKKLRPQNAQRELYLTDLIGFAADDIGVDGIVASPVEVMGVNDQVELARADRLMRLRIAEQFMRAGVTVRDPEQLYVDSGVVVGPGSELGPGVHLRGATVIGRNCRIDAGVVLSDVNVGDDVHIKPYCVLTESRVERGAVIGPWAHLRPGSHLEENVHVGNFVETKKTRMGRGSKANHLSYLGDADIGAAVNIGCGTITCNYDGYKKSRTVIEDGAFIGSDTQLVAPVKVGKAAVVGAGTTVYKDVPAGALALTRTNQTIVPGYAARKKASQSSRKSR